MKFTPAFKVPSLDLGGYRTALHKYLSEKLAHAAAEWLHSTADTIPVWTGASRSTFSPLAAHVGYVLTGGAVAPAHAIASASFGEGTGTFEADPAGKYVFTYSTTLTHLIINEYHNANQWGFHLTSPGPYRFQERGAEKFKSFVARLELPSVTPFVQSITV